MKFKFEVNGFGVFLAPTVVLSCYTHIVAVSTFMLIFGSTV